MIRTGMIWIVSRISMVVVDGLVPIWCQVICNHHVELVKVYHSTMMEDSDMVSETRWVIGREPHRVICFMTYELTHSLTYSLFGGSTKETFWCAILTGSLTPIVSLWPIYSLIHWFNYMLNRTLWYAIRRAFNNYNGTTGTNAPRAITEEWSCWDKLRYSKSRENMLWSIIYKTFSVVLYTTNVFGVRVSNSCFWRVKCMPLLTPKNFVAS